MNNQLFFKIIIILVGIAGMSGCVNFPRVYHVGDNYGWVIDSESSKPIKEVIVLEVWELEGGASFLSETDFTGVLLLREAVTDDNGYYYFEPKGSVYTTKGRLSIFDPKLVFYKKGYDYKLLVNDYWDRGRDDKDSRWEGEKIKLVKFTGTEKDYNFNLKHYSDFLYWKYNSDDFKCMWTNIPKFTAALLKERPENIGRIKPYYIPQNHVLTDEDCSDIDDILENDIK